MELMRLAFAALICGCVSAKQTPLTTKSLEDIPPLGFGTWNLKGDNVSAAVSFAIETGYRHIDCAKIYGNQVDVGKGIGAGLEKAGVRREDIWVTSKLWNDQHGKDNAEDALKDTLKELGLDYLDLYLMHWPVDYASGKPTTEYLDTWQGMIKLLDTGLTKRIGVSNFSPKQLDRLIQSAPRFRPYAHQFESHPYLKQADFVAWHRKNGIKVTAYSPLGNTNPTYNSAAEKVPPLLENAVVREIAERRNCTAAQVALKWGLQRGTAVIPKARQAAHIAENFAADGCGLQTADVKRLEGELATKRFNNPSEGWAVCLYEGLEDGNSCNDGT